MKHFFKMERPAQGINPAAALQTPAAFQPLPAPTGSAPFHLDLKTIISAGAYKQVNDSKKIIFHFGGDTGGVKQPADQQIVADHIEMQFDKQHPQNNPYFFLSPWRRSILLWESS